MGSVAEEILRRSPVPVLIVRSAAANWTNERPIVCAVNDSAASRAALLRAATLAACAGAKLLVLHVQEPGSKPLEPGACEWLAESNAPQCEIEEIVRSGKAAEQIIELTAERDANLLVLGSEHKRFSNRTVLGSTTDSVIKQAPCPVLAVAVEDTHQRATSSQV